MNKSAVRKRRRSFTRQFYKGNTSAFALAVLETVILVGANLMISWLMQKLIDVTREAFFEGMKYAKAGNHLNDICKAIGDYAESRGYGVVRDLIGHGIGTHLHEDPEVPNFDMKKRGIKLRPGMTLAIEPMINIGTWEVDWLDDDWTVVTADGELSAHYENTILITDGEPEIFTLNDSL